MRYRILAQGDLDGACFLYAMANAHVALRHTVPTTTAWDRAVDAVPFSHDFLLARGGTTIHYQENTAFLEYAMRLFLEELSGRRRALTVGAHPGITALDDVGGLIAKDAVAVFCFRGDTDSQTGLHHWVVGVGYDRRAATVRIACSAARHHLGAAYREQRDAHYRRYCNDSISANAELKIMRGTVFRMGVPARR